MTTIERIFVEPKRSAEDLIKSALGSAHDRAPYVIRALSEAGYAIVDTGVPRSE